MEAKVEALGEAALLVLVEAIERLSSARSAADVAVAIRSAARALSGADGVTFVLREGEQCHYLDEDAIGPLWKGRRFPMSACISGWAMSTGQTAVIPDIYQDERIPQDAYRTTFVRSLVMTPVGQPEPMAAIGAYWGEARAPSAAEVARLALMARAAATALQNVRLITALEAAVERRDGLIRELDHRVKNNLATVRAIADQTLRASPSPETFAQAFTGRLMALSRAHELVNRRTDGDPRLHEVIGQATGPDAEGRLSAHGPDVRLSAQTALNFQLAFHELTTNAVRHGALSRPEGRVEVRWSVEDADEDPRLRLRWTERGGPPAVPPARTGFGLKLVEAHLARSLGGASEVRFEPEGVNLELVTPLSEAISLG